MTSLRAEWMRSLASKCSTKDSPGILIQDHEHKLNEERVTQVEEPKCSNSKDNPEIFKDPGYELYEECITHIEVPKCSNTDSTGVSEDTESELNEEQNTVLTTLKNVYGDEFSGICLPNTSSAVVDDKLHVQGYERSKRRRVHHDYYPTLTNDDGESQFSNISNVSNYSDEEHSLISEDDSDYFQTSPTKVIDPTASNEVIEQNTTNPKNSTAENSLIEVEVISTVNDANEEDVNDPDNQIYLIAENSDLLQPSIRKRSKKSNPSTWKKNIEKGRRLRGEPHNTVKGLHKPGRVMKMRDCSKCPYKCNKNFDEAECTELFSTFWKMESLDRQRQYVVNLVDEGSTGSKRTSAQNSRRSKTLKYNIITNNMKKQVCKGFFCSILAVSETFVRTALKKCNSQKIVETEQRGKHTPSNKKSEHCKKLIEEHINSFPCVPSHYCRKDSSKRYLSHELSKSLMYDLYRGWCEEKGIHPEKFWLYDNVFNSLNLSFHKPRKDWCDKCFVFNKMTGEEKIEMEQNQNLHLKNKMLAHEYRDMHKLKAENGELHFIEFDMEAVCYCPSVNSKAIFYKRRLALYNLTVLDIGLKRALCYCWHEGIAKRGSIEISSCLLNYFQKIADGKEIHMSDTCGGQNRNVNVAAFCLYSVDKFNIPVINQVFFEPGHSQMEVDSVHGMIEKSKKNVEIFDPSGFYTVIRMACKKNPYEVVEMDQSDFKDFNKIKNDLIKNKKVDTECNDVSWMKMKWIQFRKDDLQHIYFKYSLDDPQFLKMKVIRRGRKSSNYHAVLEPAYKETLPIQREKHRDLMDLCNSGIIRPTYQPFYQALKSSSNDVDLNEDDIE